MALRQRGLDRGLALQQPIERQVEFVLVHFAKAKHLAEARCRGGARQCTGGSQFGCRVENAPDKKGKDKITATITVRAEDTVKANPAGGAESGRDVAVWQTDRLHSVRLRTLPFSR